MQKIDLLAAIKAFGINLADVRTKSLYDQIVEIDKAKIFEYLKANGELVDGGYEYHYSDNETPYVSCTCTNWDEDEDVKVFAIRMTDAATLTIECAPKSDPDCRMQIGASDIAYGQLEFLI